MDVGNLAFLSLTLAAIKSFLMASQSAGAEVIYVVDSTGV